MFTEWEEQRIAKLKSLRSYAKMSQVETANVWGKFTFYDLYFFLWLILKICLDSFEERQNRFQVR